jgi:hypothetical protein
MTGSRPNRRLIYPERDVNRGAAAGEYDFIVVGAGTAGTRNPWTTGS